MKLTIPKINDLWQDLTDAYGAKNEPWLIKNLTNTVTMEKQGNYSITASWYIRSIFSWMLNGQFQRIK